MNTRTVSLTIPIWDHHRRPRAFLKNVNEACNRLIAETDARCVGIQIDEVPTKETSMKFTVTLTFQSREVS